MSASYLFGGGERAQTLYRRRCECVEGGEEEEEEGCLSMRRMTVCLLFVVIVASFCKVGLGERRESEGEEEIRERGEVNWKGRAGEGDRQNWTGPRREERRRERECVCEWLSEEDTTTMNELSRLGGLGWMKFRTREQKKVKEGQMTAPSPSSLVTWSLE